MQLSERDRQQAQTMLDRLERFRQGRLPLHVLVADLEVLFGAIAEAPRQWKEDFVAQWEVLEEINALALAEGRTAAAGEERPAVEQAVAALEALLR